VRRWIWVGDGAKAVVGVRREAARMRMERCILALSKSIGG
jgi:hypothetical protein